MIHGYHVIWGTYGFWLPNDPRGSWSDFVYAWELARFGRATKSLDRTDVEPAQYALWRAAARQALKYPPVTLSGRQARAIAEGFGQFARKSELGIWACSVLPEHVHLVLSRHRYKIEQAVKLLKGEASRRLLEVNLHPMKRYRKSVQERLPAVWGENQWKVYLDSEEAIENAIRYVEKNPLREGKRSQRWTFVRPFEGIPKGGWVTYS
jgi:REP element-mobilizing transposase RayT